LLGSAWIFAPGGNDEALCCAGVSIEQANQPTLQWGIFGGFASGSTPGLCLPFGFGAGLLAGD